MAKRTLPTLEFLIQRLHCDPIAGTLHWKPRSADDFPNGEAGARAWNAKCAGKAANVRSGASGYRQFSMTVDGLPGVFAVHRIMWKMATGRDPEGDIDHINGDTADNRLANLRDVPRIENLRNSKRPRHNTSGCAGVSWHRNYGQWQAYINLNGRSHFLGRFTDKADAIAARKAAEVRYGFHANHGRDAA